MRSRNLLLVPLLAVINLPDAVLAEVTTIPVSPHRSGLEMVDHTDDQLTFRVTVGELASMDVTTNAGPFSRLMLPGFHFSREIGKPELPMINRLVEIPCGADVSVDVVSLETREMALAEFGITRPLMPAQPEVPMNQDPETLPFHWDRAVYALNQDYGFPIARVVEVGRLRGVRVGRLEIAPVSYNPVSGTIKVHDDIELVVRFSGADREQDTYIKMCTRSPFFETVYERLAGYRVWHQFHPDLLDGPVTYVIVSDPMFEAQLQPFIQWKTEQGFNVIVGYTDDPEVGTTTTSIQDYLHGLFRSGTPENPSPTFVLFAGDVAQIPAFSLTGWSDLPYCDVSGDDIPEMYYGRFSANNTSEFQPQIDKTLEYERFLFPDPAFLGEAVMIAGEDPLNGSSYGNGSINYGTNLYFNLAHGILSHTYLCPGSGDHEDEIVQHVSDGCCYVNYVGHGTFGCWVDPNFNMNDIYYLENNHEYCLVVGNACMTSDFGGWASCFAEHWLRVPDKGAIGYIGASHAALATACYYWTVGAKPLVSSGPDYDPDHLGAFDGMFHDHGESLGYWYVVQDAHIFCGNLAVQEAGSPWGDYYWEIYNLMGDPSLSAYFGVPDSNDVVLPASIAHDASEVIVLAHPKSYVGLTKDGALVGNGLVGETGAAVIPISGQGADGHVHVVVTCQNKIPYVADIPVQDLTSVSEGVDVIASASLELHQNRPNPFNPVTEISYRLVAPEARPTTLKVYDTAGRLVRTLVDEEQSAGEHRAVWDGADGRGRQVASGVFLCLLTSGTEQQARKMILLK